MGYMGETEAWERHKTSKEVMMRSDDPDLSSFEDLQPSPRGYAFDGEHEEWGVEVAMSEGWPKRRLGVLVLRVVGEQVLVSVEG